MDFSLSDDRRMLVDSLSRYLTANYGFARREEITGSPKGWSHDIWRELAELGAVGALFEEASGGFGGGGFDIGVVFGEAGRALVVEPLLGTLLAGRLLAACGQAELLGPVIAGERLVTFAHEEPNSRYDLGAVATRAVRTGDGWSLTGAKAVVPHAAQADLLVVTARSGEGDGGLSTFLVERGATGLSVRDYGLIDGGTAGELTLVDTPATVLGDEGKAMPEVECAIAAGLVALAWEAVAVMDVLKAQTLDYLRTRKQFGVPIGKFQALQHRMATLALEIEQARSAAINAAAALEGPRGRRERAVSAAKFTIGRVGTLAAEEAIQMHGGIGMTWELSLSHYAKRLIMIGHQLGDEDHHLERYIALGQHQAAA